MKTATRFQFWSMSNAARAILVIVAAMMLFVVTAAMFERPLPEPKSSQENERKQDPGVPNRHHRWDTRV
jgi:hypothetical protein